MVVQRVFVSVVCVSILQIALSLPLCPFKELLLLVVMLVVVVVVLGVGVDNMT